MLTVGGYYAGYTPMALLSFLSACTVMSGEAYITEDTYTVDPGSVV